MQLQRLPQRLCLPRKNQEANNHAMDQITKTRFEVLGAILILIGLIIVLDVIFGRKQPEGGTRVPGENIVDQQPNSPSAFVPSGPPEYLPQPVARGFVERFGSFSSEAGEQNIQDVLPLATETLRSRLESLIRTTQQTKGNGYYGISTRVITMSVVDETDTAATLAVKTQRTESIDSPANTSTRYQDLELTLVRTGDAWLVDDYTWK